MAATAIASACTAVVAFVALGLLGLAASGAFMPPVKATAHWLFGPQAARPGLLWPITPVALVAHVLACVFWAALMVLAIRLARVRGTLGLSAAGIVTGIVALVVD